MLLLVLPYRDDVGVIEEDVGRHQHRVVEKAGIRLEAFCHFVLIGMRLHEERYGDEALEYPRELGVLRDARLLKDDDLLRVDTDAEVVEDDVDYVGAQERCVLHGGQGVVIRDHEHAVVLLIGIKERLKRAEIVADVERAGGLEAGEQSLFRCCHWAIVAKKPTVVYSIRMKIGFIGQGWIGKHYADEMEGRGYDIVRYALEAPYNANKERLVECDIVFIAVPTPTTPKGFDPHIVESVIPLVGKGKIAVIKSTVLPGTTEAIQRAYPDRIVMHSPEFLMEKSAAHDTAHPDRNIIGISTDSPEHKAAAEKVLSVLPKASYAKIMPARAAEMVKYAGNAFLLEKILFANLFYDLAQAEGVDYELIKEAVAADPRIGPSHLNPVHASTGNAPARGAGGHCLPKDFAALCNLYEKLVPNDTEGSKLLRALENKNLRLLIESNKDAEIVEEVYGKDAAKRSQA